MKKKDLIVKWLDNQSLDVSESKAFNSLSASDSLIKISETARKFKAPEYDLDKNLTDLSSILKDRKKTSNSSKSYRLWILRIAAVFVLGLGLYFSFFSFGETTIVTLASEKSTIVLPDNSEVILNAYSSATYDAKDWNKHREITLQGEAFFKVAKGKRFDVHTTSGIISVLGTQFNVKQRKDFFEVTCYEGLVSVKLNGTLSKLSAGNTLQLIDGVLSKVKVPIDSPGWTSNRSIFKSIPYKFVIKEFERQYNKTIIVKNIDQSILFTGNFVHSDLQIALQSITIPMRLKYVIDNNKITFSKE